MAAIIITLMAGATMAGIAYIALLWADQAAKAAQHRHDLDIWYNGRGAKRAALIAARIAKGGR